MIGLKVVVISATIMVGINVVLLVWIKLALIRARGHEENRQNTIDRAMAEHRRLYGDYDA